MVAPDPPDMRVSRSDPCRPRLQGTIFPAGITTAITRITVSPKGRSDAI